MPPLARRLALAAAAAVNGDLVGVDLLPTRAAYVVAEVNGAVDFRTGYGIGFEDVYVSALLELRSGDPRAARRSVGSCCRAPQAAARSRPACARSS